MDYFTLEPQAATIGSLLFIMGSIILTTYGVTFPSIKKSAILFWVGLILVLIDRSQSLDSYI